MENGAFEDAFPIKHGDIPLQKLVFQRLPLLETDETKLSCFLISGVDIDMTRHHTMELSEKKTS